MIKEMQGNLLESDAEILAHQVNCKGIMGAGVANSIRKNLLGADDYRKYQKVCQKYASEDLLGRNQYFQVRNQQLVCNMFAENIPTGNGLDTDYDALKKCLHRLLREAKNFKRKTVAIPGYLGCGLAGGDWDYVYSDIIKPIFDESEIKLSIVYFPDAMEKLWKSYHNVKKENNCIAEAWHGFTQGTPTSKVKEYLATI